MIHYVVGDATAPSDPNRAVIAHVCNNVGAWGAGFVLALSAKDVRPERVYQDSSQKLGSVTYAPFVGGSFVANMVAMDGLGDGSLRYLMLTNCLRSVATFAKVSSRKVHMPRIGCGLAGGDWDRVSRLIEFAFRDEDVTVYDLPKS